MIVKVCPINPETTPETVEQRVIGNKLTEEINYNHTKYQLVQNKPENDEREKSTNGKIKVKKIIQLKLTIPVVTLN